MDPLTQALFAFSMTLVDPTTLELRSVIARAELTYEECLDMMTEEPIRATVLAPIEAIPTATSCDPVRNDDGSIKTTDEATISPAPRPTE